MKWFTREGAKTDRVACPWLIRRFIDPAADFVFLPADRVVEAARREGGKSFDCDGADFGHRGSDCSFETLVKEFGLADEDLALFELAAVVHTADVATDPGDPRFRPEGAGLRAMGEGFALTVPDDHEKLKLEFPLYDALYALCSRRAH